MAQYLILLYEEERAWADVTTEELQGLLALHFEFHRANATAILGGHALQPTTTARSIRRDDEAEGGFVVTDGAFAETTDGLTPERAQRASRKTASGPDGLTPERAQRASRKTASGPDGLTPERAQRASRKTASGPDGLTPERAQRASRKTASGPDGLTPERAQRASRKTARQKEALGGFYLIEAADDAEAVAIAKQVPAPRGGVEVRPIMLTPGA